MNLRAEYLAPHTEMEFDMHEVDVVEIPLLLSGRQISALETAAHNRGLTAAEMVRHVLRDFLSHADRTNAAYSPSSGSSAPGRG